jgi:alpha-D-xyloside xylohydrolase
MSTTYELPTFLGETLPVELVSRLVSYEVDGSSVVLHCATDRYDPTRQDYFGTVAETVHTPPVEGQPATVRLDLVSPAVVRVRYRSGDSVPEGRTPMLVHPLDADVAVQLEEDERVVRLRTSEVTVEVTRDPFQLTLRGTDDAVLWTTKPVDEQGLRRPEKGWSPDQQRWLFLHRYAYPLGSVRSQGRTAAFASFDLHHEERVYGFGEDFGRLVKNGTWHRLWLQETFSNASPASYKQVPFWMSTRGAGVFVNTSHATGVHVGDLEHSALSLTVEDTDALDLFVIAGPSLRQILPRYTALTGAPAVPPQWTFGLWMSRITYRSQAEVEAVAATLREHRIPCDVLHVDTGWFREEYVCDLEFDPDRFPDVPGMTARLRQLGLRVSLWQWPNVNVNSSMFPEGLAGGHLALRESGHVYLQPGGYGEDAGVIDYSSPAAVAWVQQKYARLFAQGVAALKVDYGEGAPPDAVYQGVPSEAMHNLYPLLYGKAVWDATVAARGEDDAVLWARAAWAGSQRYPVHWSGDGVARWQDLPCVLRSMLSFGLSGFPFYSHDIGGFSGWPSPEIYLRWAQLGLFSSHARAHGAGQREPWHYGEQVEDAFRRYAELRYRLLPYLWTEARRCGETSLPMVRAMVLDFQDDPSSEGIDDQYLLGESLLVAPVVDERDHRRVWFPAGDWVDFWTGEVVTGPVHRTVSAPLDVLPLWVRAGAVLPLGPVQQHTAEAPIDPLTVQLHAPAASGSYTVRTDAGDIAVDYRREGDVLHVTVDGAPGEVAVELRGSEPLEVRLTS